MTLFLGYPHGDFSCLSSFFCPYFIWYAGYGHSCVFNPPSFFLTGLRSGDIALLGHKLHLTVTVAVEPPVLTCGHRTIHSWDVSSFRLSYILDNGRCDQWTTFPKIATTKRIRLSSPSLWHSKSPFFPLLLPYLIASPLPELVVARDIRYGSW